MSKSAKLKLNKRKLTVLEEESISIVSFLVRVLGIRDQNFLSGKISHRDLKAIFPNLSRPSFDYIVENPVTVYNGDVFLVKDSFGSIVPYYNPELVLDDAEFFGEYVEEPTIEEIPRIDEIDLKSLSNYELEGLLHIYERHNIRSAYRRVRKELIFRKDSRHASNESKARCYKKERKNRRQEEY